MRLRVKIQGPPTRMERVELAGSAPTLGALQDALAGMGLPSPVVSLNKKVGLSGAACTCKWSKVLQWALSSLARQIPVVDADEHTPLAASLAVLDAATHAALCPLTWPPSPTASVLPTGPAGRRCRHPAA